MKKWNHTNIPDQTGRTAIVTGANAGLGLETARVLAGKGAKVIMACRSKERGQAAMDTIEVENPSGSVELAIVDLSRLESVKSFAASFSAEHRSLDLLINNAGVMTPPESKTADGFELQIGVNFLGHFALTALLFPLLEATEGSRVVTLSSLAHRMGKIDLASFRGATRYRPWREYGQSKLACLMFAIEMQQRLDRAGIPIRSLAAHPGGTRTDLQRHSLMSRMLGFMMMDVQQGTLPTLYAATEPTAQGGEYFGPDGIYEMRGYPAPAKIAKQANDEEARDRLWQIAEELTGVTFEIGAD